MKERGTVLVLSFIILVTMASMVGSYLFTTSVVLKSVGFGDVDDKVIALAEAGLRKAVWSLMTPTPVGRGENWTTAGVTESLGSGSYTMVVARWDFAFAANGSTATASSSTGSHTANKAIDGDDSTYWESKDKPTAANPEEIIITFPYTLTLNKVRFLTSDSNNRPKNYTWRISTDGSSYTTVVTVSGNSNTDVTNTFTAASNVNYLKLSVTESGQANKKVRVATLEAIGSRITSTGTIDSLSRTVTQTVVADDGAPQNQVAFYEPDWTEL